jgi:hypothetical protein
VAKPLGGGWIVGSGKVANVSDSSGYIAGDPGQNTCYAFDVQYNKGGSNPQGKVAINVLSHRKPDGTLDTILHTYQIRSTAIATMAVQAGPGTATFSSKANVVDVTNPASPISLEGNSVFQMDITDGHAAPGVGDTIGISVQRKSGGMWFTLKWNGLKTVQKPIAAGEISVQ